MRTLKQVFDEVHKRNPFNICFGDFLDEFYRADPEMRNQMIKEEPSRYDTIERVAYVYAAASAHKLANDFGLHVPEWVFDRYYFLKEPYFSMNAKGSLRLLLLYESPAEFKFRNMFEMENTLHRV